MVKPSLGTQAEAPPQLPQQLHGAGKGPGAATTSRGAENLPPASSAAAAVVPRSAAPAPQAAAAAARLFKKQRQTLAEQLYARWNHLVRVGALGMRLLAPHA